MRGPARSSRQQGFNFRVCGLTRFELLCQKRSEQSPYRNHLDNLAQAHIFNSMEHRGIEYSVVQGIERGTWKWFAVIDATMTRSGQAKSRPVAVADAKRAIDKAIARRE